MNNGDKAVSFGVVRIMMPCMVARGFFTQQKMGLCEAFALGILDAANMVTLVQ